MGERPPLPGTTEPGYVEPRVVEVGDRGSGVRARLEAMGSLGVRFFEIGETRVILAREVGGVNGERLWHLTISCVDRHPTWDEIKTARYRLLPLDRAFGILLPPPEVYINVAAQDHVFHLWEIDSPSRVWETM